MPLVLEHRGHQGKITHSYNNYMYMCTVMLLFIYTTHDKSFKQVFFTCNVDSDKTYIHFWDHHKNTHSLWRQINAIKVKKSIHSMRLYLCIQCIKKTHLRCTQTRLPDLKICINQGTQVTANYTVKKEFIFKIYTWKLVFKMRTKFRIKDIQQKLNPDKTLIRM